MQWQATPAATDAKKDKMFAIRPTSFLLSGWSDDSGIIIPEFGKNRKVGRRENCHEIVTPFPAGPVILKKR